MTQPNEYPYNVEITQNMVVRPTTMRQSSPLTLDQYINARDWAHDVGHTSREIEAVSITMPKEDFHHLMEVYSSHFRPANDHPGVMDAWYKYREMVALTRRDF